jgi:hypothetical protein
MSLIERPASAGATCDIAVAIEIKTVPSRSSKLVISARAVARHRAELRHIGPPVLGSTAFGERL